jgi:hypothetical protein
MQIKPEWIKWRERGWRFAYDPSTRFLGCEHPSGGKKSIASFERFTGSSETMAHQIGFTMADFLNDRGHEAGGLAGQSPSEFIDHFHKQPGIDPSRTNYDLIDALFDCLQKQEPGVTSFKCGRGIGATQTLRGWAEWVRASVLVVAQPFGWRHANIRVQSWTTSIRGLRIRPDIVLIDSAISKASSKSVVESARFEEWLGEIPYPAFLVDQRLAK